MKLLLPKFKYRCLADSIFKDLLDLNGANGVATTVETTPISGHILNGALVAGIRPQRKNIKSNTNKATYFKLEISFDFSGHAILGCISCQNVYNCTPAR